MSDISFLWHDYESFGVNPRYDRPSQFAAVRTDQDFNILEEPIMEYCRPVMDYVPHPEACWLTGISPQQADAEGWPEPEFIRRVLEQLGRPGTCGVGYNNLRFDDEMTRHTAWRNFYDPYAREWQNQCSRWDIIDMVRMTYALRPEGINWPTHDRGGPSFKLEALAQANNLQQERAHDALSDVYATIDLARLIRSKQPRLYDYVVSHRDKRSAAQLLNWQQHQPVLHVSSRFPAEQGCLSVVLPICPHPTNKNVIVVCDLRHDPSAWLELPPEDLAERIFTPRQDLPEGIERASLKGVHLNRCPVLAPLATLKPEQAERLQLDVDQCLRYADQITAVLEDLSPRVQWVFGQQSFDGSSDPEQNLYDGFVGAQDRRLCDQVLQASGEDFDGMELPFEDSRLHDLLFRFRARHYPDSLNEAERDEWARHCSRRIEFGADGGITLDDYFSMLDAASNVDPQMTAALREWGERLRATL